MGTIKCGFWQYRFFVTPIEFAAFIDICVKEDFSFYHTNYAGEQALIEEIKHSYCIYYYNITGEKYNINCKENTDASVVYSMKNPNFKGGLGIVDGKYGKIKFVSIYSSKSYAVNSEDGKYFHYEDILKKEPRAKEVFDILICDLKKITKPLYENEKPAYSIRISNNAWNDIKNKGYAGDLLAKW